MAMLQELDSHVRSPGFRHDEATQCLAGVASRPFVDLRHAYTFARGVARIGAEDPAARASASASAPGHRLVWVRGAAFGCAALAAAEQAFTVVGRHSQCGVVLREDPFVALRHVLVRSIVLPAGGVALRVLDLHTGMGFVLPDGSQRTSIFAEGPIAVAVGEYALIALPNESKGDELPGEMPAPVVETPPAVRDEVQALAAAMSPYRVSARPLNRTSRITLMSSPVMVGEPLPPSLGRLAAGGQHALTLARGDRSATVMITEEDLARGVILGRSDKCHTEMLRRLTDENTSRVHILVLREGPVVYAYDLASTQGTYVNRMPTRRVLLADGGTMISLGRGHDAVRLLWHSQR